MAEIRHGNDAAVNADVAAARFPSPAPTLEHLRLYAGIAQLVEHLHGKEKVVGSNPIPSLFFIRSKYRLKLLKYSYIFPRCAVIKEALKEKKNGKS